MSIQVEYWITHPAFLHRRFSSTRACLRGQRPRLSWRSRWSGAKARLSSLRLQPPTLLRAEWVRPQLSAVSRVNLRPQLPALPKLPARPQWSFRPQLPALPKFAPLPKPAWFESSLTIISWLLIISSLVVAVVVFAPSVYYRLVPADTKPIQAAESGTPRGGSFEDGAKVIEEAKPYMPPQDATLPEGDWIIIPRIGVRTQIRPTEDPEEALSQGVWRAPDFGTPEENELPIILAAHRFGWDWWWQSDFWRYNSFYLLPETEPGDIVEIISDQRKWVYEIYAGEEGEEISDYDGNLILYTCKFLNSPLRHFRYARLIDPTKNTQSTPLELSQLLI